VGTSDGFIVTGVQEDSPAAAAGLQRGILVTAMEGQTAADLTAAAKLLYSKKKGDRVQLEIAVLKPLGGFNVLQQGAVEVGVR
jgi:S1-C subfamily serine protease